MEVLCIECHENMKRMVRGHMIHDDEEVIVTLANIFRA
jgi:hypothetical protein